MKGITDKILPEYGAKYASGAGYDPRGLITFFQKLQKQEGKTPQIMKFLSDHPATPDRISHLDKYIADHHLSGIEGWDPDGLPAVKKQLLPQAAAVAPHPSGRAAGGPTR